MKIKQITEIEYTLTESEFHLFLKCLKYCKHRLLKHEKVGIHKALNEENRKKLLKFLEDF